MHCIPFELILYFYLLHFVSSCEPSECFTLKMDSDVHDSCISSGET
jgi:hypothetical protein